MKVTLYATGAGQEYRQQPLSPAQPMAGAVTVRTAEPLDGRFDGFGVAVTGSSCYNLSRMPAEERTALLRHLYSAEGLGLSVARLTIGSSDYSAELYSYDDTPGDIALSHFSIHRDRACILPILREILAINPSLTLFASPWSPPGWMKTGGSLCGGYMREEYIGCYADYIVRYLKAYEEEGIRIAAITPQNEPETQQSGRMPACIWHPEAEAKFILTLRKKLDENGLDTRIWMHDHNFVGCDRVLWELDTYPALLQACDGVAFHYYEGSIEQTDVLAQKHPGLARHFTEGGPRLYDNYATDWCKWSVIMAKVLAHGYRSFTGWNLMLDETGGPNIGPFFCGGLITRHSDTGALSHSGQYKALRHFAPFFKPGAAVLPVAVENGQASLSAFPHLAQPTEGCAWQNLDGTRVLVLINSNKQKQQVQYLYGGQWWYIELLPDTVVTVTFEEE